MLPSPTHRPSRRGCQAIAGRSRYDPPAGAARSEQPGGGDERPVPAPRQGVRRTRRLHLGRGAPAQKPIAGIQAQAEAAESAPDEAELRARVAGIAEAARRTSRLTQQLLSLEKIKGRDAETHQVAFDLDQLAANVMKRHAPDALRSGVQIAFEVEGEPKPMRGDPVLLTEALDNLIDNALRYGCADGGELELRLAFAPEGARLTVRDQGPGVPMSERERIFERFHRAVEDGVDGCGLGLAIVREVAERHGGRISLAETIQGACFDLPTSLSSGHGHGDRLTMLQMVLLAGSRFLRMVWLAFSE